MLDMYTGRELTFSINLFPYFQSLSFADLVFFTFVLFFFLFLFFSSFLLGGGLSGEYSLLKILSHRYSISIDTLEELLPTPSEELRAARSDHYSKAYLIEEEEDQMSINYGMPNYSFHLSPLLPVYSVVYMYSQILHFFFFFFFFCFSILTVPVDWSQEIEKEKKKDEDDVMFKKVMKDANHLNVTSSPIDLRRQLNELKIKLSSSNKRNDDEGSVESSVVESNVEPAAAASPAAASPAAAPPAAASKATRAMTKKRTRRCV